DRVSRTFGIGHGQVRGERARGPRTLQRDLERLEGMGERIVHGGSLEATVSHAVVAARIASHAVLVPLRGLEQRAEARRAPLVGEQITRPLPPEDVVRGIAPRRALIALIAGEKIEKQTRVIEGPAPRAPTPALEDLAKQAFARAAREEHVLARSMVV